MGGLLAQLAAVGAFDAQPEGGEPTAGDPADDSENTAYLWPESVAAWGHWQRLQTQWRAGMGPYPTGMDYAGVRNYFDLAGIAPAERAELFECVQACEAACLDVWAQVQRQPQPQPQRATTPPAHHRNP